MHGLVVREWVLQGCVGLGGVARAWVLQGWWYVHGSYRGGGTCMGPTGAYLMYMGIKIR